MTKHLPVGIFKMFAEHVLSDGEDGGNSVEDSTILDPRAIVSSNFVYL